jgi:hypothetical protein
MLNLLPLQYKSTTAILPAASAVQTKMLVEYSKNAFVSAWLSRKRGCARSLYLTAGGHTNTHGALEDK